MLVSHLAVRDIRCAVTLIGIVPILCSLSVASAEGNPIDTGKYIFTNVREFQKKPQEALAVFGTNYTGLDSHHNAAAFASIDFEGEFPLDYNANVTLAAFGRYRVGFDIVWDCTTVAAPGGILYLVAGVHLRADVYSDISDLSIGAEQVTTTAQGAASVTVIHGATTLTPATTAVLAEVNLVGTGSTYTVGATYKEKDGGLGLEAGASTTIGGTNLLLPKHDYKDAEINQAIPFTGDKLHVILDYQTFVIADLIAVNGTRGNARIQAAPYLEMNIESDHPDCLNGDCPPENQRKSISPAPEPAPFVLAAMSVIAALMRRRTFKWQT